MLDSTSETFGRTTIVSTYEDGEVRRSASAHEFAKRRFPEPYRCYTANSSTHPSVGPPLGVGLLCKLEISGDLECPCIHILLTDHAFPVLFATSLSNLKPQRLMRSEGLFTKNAMCKRSVSRGRLDPHPRYRMQNAIPFHKRSSHFLLLKRPAPLRTFALCVDHS
jgi:hypothetical protein